MKLPENRECADCHSKLVIFAETVCLRSSLRYLGRSCYRVSQCLSIFGLTVCGKDYTLTVTW